MKIKLMAVMTMFFVCTGISFGATHLFTDGVIPEGMEFSVGYINWDTDFYDPYFLTFRLEMPMSDRMSLFGEFQLNDYDFESTFSVGAGGFYNLLKDGPDFPMNLTLGGALFYQFEGDDWLESVFSLDARAILSKEFHHAVHWTPYACLILHHWRTDDFDDTDVEFSVGVNFEFNQFAIGLEALFADTDAIGLTGSYRF